MDIPDIRSTTALCVFCGCALLYVKRRQLQQRFRDVPLSSERGDEEDTVISQTMDSPSHTSSSSFFQRLVWALWGSDPEFKHSVDCVFETVRSTAEQVTELPQGLRKSYTRNAEYKLKLCLEVLATYTKNEKFIDQVIKSETLDMLRTIFSKYKQAIDFPMHVLLAEIFANISSQSKAKVFLSEFEVQELIQEWRSSNSLHLNLYASKIDYNLQPATEDSIVFLHDIYQLNAFDTSEHNFQFDVIFINGMLGSTFFTWRQHDDEAANDENYTKCWPRDWLAYALPTARILSVNANLKPFIWNPICPVDRMKRGLEAWSRDVMMQLERAGVGRRPIVWVTHSAGGLLVKELLRQCVKDQERSHLIAATKGIVFISVPHRGSQSLRGLHYYPFKLALTTEASEMKETPNSDTIPRHSVPPYLDADALVDLHSWFMVYANQKDIATLNMVETKLTRINWLYWVLLVPEDNRDSSEFSEVVRVDIDHLYISKPKNKDDLVYTSILNFVQKCCLHDRHL